MSFSPGPWPACDVAEIALAICLTERGYIGSSPSFRRAMRTSRRYVTSANEVRSYFQAGTPPAAHDFEEARQKVLWRDVEAVCDVMEIEPGTPVGPDGISDLVTAAHVVITRSGTVLDQIRDLGDRAKVFEASTNIETLRVQVEYPHYFENVQHCGFRYAGLADGVYPVIWFVNKGLAREQPGREYILHKVRVESLQEWKGVEYSRIRRSWFEPA